MELIEGRRSPTSSRRAIPVDEALPIAKQMAEALEAARGRLNRLLADLGESLLSEQDYVPVRAASVSLVSFI